jgi:PAT family beta-lactamase induction signal transducer AmpG
MAERDSNARKRRLRTLAAILSGRRMLAMLLLGFFSALPLILVFDTLSAWLREAGIALEVITFFSLVTLVYSFKFIWAPLVDRVRIPLLIEHIGHRRSWMMVCQLLIVVGLTLMAAADPASDLVWVALSALFVGFASATQDIAIDAWRIESADASEQGMMAAAYQWGYYAAAILGASVPFVVAQRIDWRASYLTMAGVMACSLLVVLATPRESEHRLRPVPLEGIPRRPLRDTLEWLLRLALVSAGAMLVGAGLSGNLALAARLGVLASLGLFQLACVIVGFALIILAACSLPGARTRPGVYLHAAFGEPLTDFFHRYRGLAALILALICFYRLSSLVLSVMNPYYLDIGFTLTELAEVRSVYGVAASMLGLLLGGMAIARLGLFPALVIGAFAGPLNNLLLIWLTFFGPELPALFFVVGVNSLSNGFAGACLVAYISSLTSLGFSATQYALFSSLFALPARVLASQSGQIVETAAKAADSGGWFTPLASWFGALPTESFADALSRSDVPPAALAAGYVVFFIYAGLLGVLGIALALVVSAREKSRLASARVSQH